jgi:hypothetical protein
MPAVRHCNTLSHGTQRASTSRRNSPLTSGRSWPCLHGRLGCKDMMSGRAQGIKTPYWSSHSGGGSVPAPSGNHPSWRAEEPGGVCIAALPMARATATRIVLPESPKASHLRRRSIYGAQAPSCQEKVSEPLRARSTRQKETLQAPRPRARVSWTPWSDGYIATRCRQYRNSRWCIARRGSRPGRELATASKGLGRESSAGPGWRTRVAFSCACDRGEHVFAQGSEEMERALTARIRGWPAGKWPAPPVP